MGTSTDCTLKKHSAQCDNLLIFLLLIGKLKRFCLAVNARDLYVNEVVNELWVGCCNVLRAVVLIWITFQRTHVLSAPQGGS